MVGARTPEVAGPEAGRLEAGHVEAGHAIEVGRVETGGSAAALGDGWAVYTDERTGCLYYFNHLSGASQWHRPTIAGKLLKRPSAVSVQPAASAAAYKNNNQDEEQEEGPGSGSGSEEDGGDEEEDGSDEDADEDGSDDNDEAGAASDSDAERDLDASRASEREREYLLDGGAGADAGQTADVIRSEAELSSAVRFYVVSSLFHVALIEAPLGALEGIFVGLARALLGLAALLVALARYALERVGVLATAGVDSRVVAPRLRDILRGRIWAGLQLCAAGVTLLVPGAALLPYRDMIASWREGRMERSVRVDDFALLSVPSLLGPVDARRLRTFARGQGGHAKNVRSLRAPMY
jgi:hypothetical protein